MSVNVGTAVGFLDLDTSGWTEGLDSARAGMSSFMDEEASFSNRMKGLGGTMQTVGKTMSVGMTTSLTAIAGVMTNKAKEMQGAVQKVSRAVGESIEEVERYKDVIASIYASNLGESFEDVADVLILVKQQMKDLNDEQLEGAIASAIQLRDTFDIDVNEGIRGANALMKQFGISAEEAYNYIAIGAQNGLNQNQDLADQISEYAVYYADLGMSVQDMFNAMYSGAKQGVYQIDYLNDAYKEFGIRVKDTAATTTEGFTLLGMDADTMRAKFAAGGESAREAFEEVINALAETDDQVIQNQVGVDLFGTKWEDIGQSTIMAITQMNDGLDLTQDLLGGMRELTMADFTRQVEVLGESFGRLLLPYLISGTDALIGFVEWLNELDPEFKSLIVQLGLFAAAAGPVIGVTGGIISNGEVLINTFTKLAPVIGAIIKTAAGMVNPFTAAITVIGLLYAAYQANIGGIQDITKEAIEMLVDYWEDFINFAPQVPEKFINFLVQGFNSKKAAAISSARAIITGIRTEFTRFLNESKQIPIDFVNGLANGIREGVSVVASAVRSLANKMLSALTESLEINSPSKAAERAGMYYDQGLELGIDKNKNFVIGAMLSLGEDLKKASVFDFSGSFDGIADAAMSGADRARSVVGSYLSELSGHASTMDSTGVLASETSGGVVNKTYNFYSNEALTPTEISRQFKKTEQDLALGF